MEVRWLGHATICVRLDGTTILTDPALRPRMAGLVRHAARPQPSAWRWVDTILISHGHRDHLDLPSLRLLGADVYVIVPNGLGAFIRGAGVRHISELKVGDRLDLGAVGLQ